MSFFLILFLLKFSINFVCFFAAFRLSNEAVSDLLYDLCTTQDEFTIVRISAVVDWAKSLYAKYGTQMNLLRTNPYSGKCIINYLFLNLIQVEVRFKILIL